VHSKIDFIVPINTKLQKIEIEFVNK